MASIYFIFPELKASVLLRLAELQRAIFSFAHLIIFFLMFNVKYSIEIGLNDYTVKRNVKISEIFINCKTK